MSLQDPDLRRPVSRGDVRTLVLPSGGTIEVPLPKSKRREITINPASRGLAEAATGSSILPVVFGIVAGAVIGGAIVWAIYRNRAA